MARLYPAEFGGCGKHAITVIAEHIEHTCPFRIRTQLAVGLKALEIAIAADGGHDSEIRRHICQMGSTHSGGVLFPDLDEAHSKEEIYELSTRTGD